MENYICINGKKAELTEEQMVALGIELPKVNPFTRHKTNYSKYFYIGSDGCAYIENDNHGSYNDSQFDVANYCTDKVIMEQRALHETLNRLLWRYSMEHKGERVDDKVWSITYHADTKEFHCGWVNYQVLFVAEIAFDTEEIGNNAIKEIIEPFMAAHPEFKW